MIVMANDVIPFISLLTLVALGVGVGGLSWAPMVCMVVCGSSVGIPLILDSSPGGASAAMGFLWPKYALMACLVALLATPGESLGQSAGVLLGFVVVASTLVMALMQIRSMFSPPTAKIV